MPTCNKCESHFPNHLFIEGKTRNLGNRKYCLLCSPFGKHNTRPVVVGAIKRGMEVTCGCGRVYIYDRKPGHTKTQCNSCSVNTRRHRIKSYLVAHKGGKCIGCGYNRSERALVFHHTNPSIKDFGIGGNHALSLTKLKAEVDKCVLLCANCHAEAHDIMDTT